jgi:hypothetical protein
MSDQNDTAELARIPVAGTELLATMVGGVPHVALTPMCEALGIDPKSQRRKLDAKSWARKVMMTSRDSAGRAQDMYMVDRRTMTMWLATIDENRVDEAARPIVRTFQSEAAEALDAYFHDGGAINPNASGSQLSDLMETAQQRIQLLALTKGIVDDAWLETKVRHQVAVALGEEPDLDPLKRTLTVSDYLDQKGVNQAGQRKFAGSMGALVKKQYRELHDTEPGKAIRFVNGADREVAAYTERDRALFDKAWSIFGSAIEPQYFMRAVTA